MRTFAQNFTGFDAEFCQGQFVSSGPSDSIVDTPCDAAHRSILLAGLCLLCITYYAPGSTVGIAAGDVGIVDAIVHYSHHPLSNIYFTIKHFGVYPKFETPRLNFSFSQEFPNQTARDWWLRI